MKRNTINATDSYKFSHFLQYPDDTTAVSSYIEARGFNGPGDEAVKVLKQYGVTGAPLEEAIRDAEANKVTESVLFGTQAYVKEYLMKPFTKGDIDENIELGTKHGVPTNRQDWLDILNKYGGFYPVMLQSAPEGTVMPLQNVQVQLRNTDRQFYWTTSYLETSGLRGIWYPSTVATMSREYKKHIKASLERTSDIPVEDQIGFKLHDFGGRGATSGESAAIGGMGHLVNFLGTDTFEAVEAAKQFYNIDMAGFSIPASEHSTITSWGEDGEKSAFKNMIRRFSKPGSIYACVSDSYDIYKAVNELWPSLKQDIINGGGTLVVRPDSGDPLTVPVEVIQALADKFGFEVNSKGYKVLPSYIRVIQGDGLNATTLPKLIANIEKAGFSLDNIAFGMGGGLLQNVNRDTFKYAMKASARLDHNHVWNDVFKDPIHGGKTSKKGVLGLVEENGVIKTVAEKDVPLGKNLLRTVYNNGELLIDEYFDTIRARAAV